MSVTCHALVAVHREEVEGLTIRVYNHALGLWEEKQRKRKVGNRCKLRVNLSLQKKKKRRRRSRSARMRLPLRTGDRGEIRRAVSVNGSICGDARQSGIKRSLAL